MASFPFRTNQVLGFAGMVLLAMAIHCGRPGGNSDKLEYLRPVIVTAVGEAIPPDQPMIMGSAGPPYAVAPALPVGVTLDAATGTLEGTATATTPQTVYTVTAGGAAGAPSTTFELTVLDAGTPLSRVLNCQDVPQTTPYWCWAASLACVLNYYGFPVTQADVAGGWNAGDRGDTRVPGIMGSYGHPGAWGPILTYAEVQAQISAGRPFIMNWQWALGIWGGEPTHDVVGYGWDIREGAEEMYIMDPSDPWSNGAIYKVAYQWTVGGIGQDQVTLNLPHAWLKTFTIDP